MIKRCINEFKGLLEIIGWLLLIVFGTIVIYPIILIYDTFYYIINGEKYWVSNKQNG